MAYKDGLKIAVGSDHGGFSLKEVLKSFLAQSGHEVVDCGTNSTAPVDYPVFARKVAEKVSCGEARFGIIVDGAGIGSAMTANKLGNVRAALCYDLSSANNAREHNNANVLTLGAGLIGTDLAKQIVKTFLTMECTAERHLRRVNMIGDAVPQTVVSGSCDSCTSCGECAEKNPEQVKEMIGLGASRISMVPGAREVPREVAGYIDHTLLKPDATIRQVKELCKEARDFSFATVCINPTFVPLARKELAGSPVLVCTVVGFPLGTHMPDVKAMETRRAIRDGAKEIDMVINVGALKSGENEVVYRDIRAVTDACQDGNVISKVIIETALLTDEEKRTACELSRRARANFVKTSTGFASGGATAKDVALMSNVVAGTGMGVKASGGIKSLDDAKEMIEAGATRIGASAGVKIVKAARA